MNLKKLFILILFITNFSVHALPTAKITLRVIDQEGLPVANAKVGVGISKPNKHGVGSDETNLSGLTDFDGLFTAKGPTEPYMGFSVKKDGFYRTLGNFRAFTGVSGIWGFRKHEPWNPVVDVVLKKKKNPIPMYVGRMRGKVILDDSPIILPEEDKFFGFDLIAKDWVVPHGQGLHSDFIFKIKVNYDRGVGDYDVSMTVKFTNLDDGIQPFYAYGLNSKKGGSALKSPHNAPIDDYQDKLVIRNHQIKNRIYKKFNREDQNYMFRVRTKRDDKENIIEAYYGKIYGNFIFSIPEKAEKGQISFSYYLNPNNNDTNIEFSQDKNIFPKPNGLRGHYRFNP